MALGGTVFRYLRQLVIMFFGGPRIPWQTTVRNLQLLVPYVALVALSCASFYSTADRTKEQVASTEWLKVYPALYLAVRAVQSAYTVFLRACPLLYLGVYVHDLAPSSDTSRRSWEAFTANLLKMSTLNSFLLSGCSDACLMEVALCVPWMMTFFGMAHLLRLVFLCVWLKGQRGFDDADVKYLLRYACGLLKRQVASCLRDLAHGRRLFRCAMVSLCLVSAVWYLCAAPWEALHDAVLLALMATQTAWYLMHAGNRAAAWGMLSTLLFLQWRASVLVDWLKPGITMYVPLVIYYTAQAACALCAVYARRYPVD